MFTLHIDLGQVVIAVLIASIGWFIKRTVDSFDYRFDKFEDRIDRHEDVLFKMNTDLQVLIGKGIARQRDPK